MRRVVIDIRTHPTGGDATLWRSTIGKKAVMAVTGLIMVLFLLLHMLGNLKTSSGPATSMRPTPAWLRTIGEPVLRGVWFLWIQRAVLLVAVVLHVVCAAELSKRDRSARPTPYAHGPGNRASFATDTMRWGGVIIGLFIVWHLLDLTAGVTNPDFERGRPYHNVVVDFQVWWINLVYIVGVVMVGLHINDGFLERDPDAGREPKLPRCRHPGHRHHAGRDDHRRLRGCPHWRDDGTGAMR